MNDADLESFRANDGQNLVDIAEELTPAPVEQILYWGTVILYTVLATAVACGLAGYLYATYF